MSCWGWECIQMMDLFLLVFSTTPVDHAYRRSVIYVPDLCYIVLGSTINERNCSEGIHRHDKRVSLRCAFLGE